jgi:flavin-dependent dehydrogenase
MNACAAHGRQGMRGGGPGLWRAGDAAAALDPLSGQGIYHAIAGARLVASAVDAVARGKAESSTQRLVANRQAGTFRRGLEIAAQFYGENAARGRFWTETAAVYRAAAAGPGEDEVN